MDPDPGHQQRGAHPRATGPTHDQGRRRPRNPQLPPRPPGCPAPTHPHKPRQEERRGRLHHHLDGDHLEASPTQIATWVQSHWGIENKLHWVRHVVYDEDRSTVRTANAPRIMATLRSTAISLLRLSGTNDIAKNTRHHARDPARPAKLLLTC